MSATTKAKHYKVTRRKVVHGQSIPMVFTWTEGDGYIGIQFPGCYEHDVIQVWDYDTNNGTITGRDGFISEVADFTKEIGAEYLAEAYQYRTRKS